MKTTVLVLMVLVLCIPVIALAQQTGGLPALQSELQSVQTNLQNQINTLQNQINSIPAGPPGPAGPAGAAGPTGATGATGPQGPVGTVSQEILDTICQLVFYVPRSMCPSFCVCPKKVFLSSATYTGNLGGLVGADTKCQGLANAAGLSGTFRAWLSDATSSAGDRLLHSTNPYVRVDGVPVANSWDDLVDGNLAYPIVVDEYGEILTGGVWTNTNPDGSITIAVPAGCCESWTQDGTFPSPYSSSNGIADELYTDYNWTNYSRSGCHAALHLYCIEQ